MTAFRSRWDDWEPKEAPLRTDKADKSPSVSFGSAPPGRFDEAEGTSVSSVSMPPRPFADRIDPSTVPTEASPSIKGPQKTLTSLTDRTDKSLPQAFNLTTDKADDRPQPERVVLLAVPPGVPEAWVQGVADLLVMPCPASCPEARWNALREDAVRFLRDHAARAHELGWTALDLFGVHPARPRERFDAMGLVPLLAAAKVVALSEGQAVIEKPSGARLTFHKRGRVPDETCLIWELET